MKNNFKRVFALLLAVVMCMTCTLPVFATTGGDVAEKCPGAGERHTFDNCTSYEQIGETVEPACGTQTGYTMYRCTVCAEPFMENITHMDEPCEWQYVDENGERKDVVEADCENGGRKHNYCLKHETEVSESVPAGHKFGAWISDSIPCKDGAVKTRTCEVCGEVETEKLEKGEHEWGTPVFPEIGEEGAPTCITEGKATVTCKLCGESKEVVVLPMADAHDWINEKTISEATCGKPAIIEHTCKICGKTEQEAKGTASGDHNFVGGEKVEAKAPTCTEAGHTAYIKCVVEGCTGKDGYEEINPLGHDFSGDPIESKDAVCGVEGYKKYKCTRCDETDTVEIPAPSKHDFEKMVVAPTCDKFGRVYYFCKNCGFDEHEDNEKLPPLYHHLEGCEDPNCTETAKEGKPAGVPCGMVVGTVTDPTCTDKGVTVYVCKASAGCTHTIEVPTDALGHDYKNEVVVDATCQAEGTKQWKCDCGEFKKDEEGNVYTETIPVDPTAHVWSEWEIATEATGCGTKGTKIKYCKICPKYSEELGNYEIVEYTEEHEAIEGTYELKEPNCTEDGYEKFTCQKCGNFIELDKEDDPKFAATGHTAPDDYTVIVEGDCTTAEVKVKNCVKCGVELERVTADQPKHNYVLMETKEEAKAKLNCEKQSCILQQKCSVCGDVTDSTVTVSLTNSDLADPERHVCLTESAKKPAIENPVRGHREGTCEHHYIYSYICPNMDDSNNGYTNAFVVIDKEYGMGHPTYKEDGTIDFLPKYIDVVSEYQAPTCAVAGQTLAWYCSYCDEFGGGEVIAKLPHDLKLVEGKPATCTEDGYLAYWQCKFGTCEAKFADEAGTQAIEEPVADTADGHVMAPADKAPTCEAAGQYIQKCENCDYEEKGAVIPALGHNYKILGEATVDCEINGYVYKTCTNEDCDGKHVEFIENFVRATGHDWDIAKDCINGDEYVCKNNSKHNYEDDPIGKHVNVDGEELNCGNAAITNRECAHCGKEIDANHDFERIEHEANCVEYGYILDVCKLCGHIDVIDTDKILQPDNHKAPSVDDKIEKKPTCTEDGYVKWYCQNDGCDKEFTAEDDPKYTYNKDDYKALGHNLVKDEATYVANSMFENGSVDYVCSRCGYTESEVIEATGGAQFYYSYDNALVAGADLVNAGTLAVTITFRTMDVSLNSICLTLNFDKNVLSYLDTKFTCDETIFVNTDTTDKEKADGKIVISARVNEDGSALTEVALEDGVYAFAVVYFEIKDSVGKEAIFSNNPNHNLSPVLKGDGESVITNKDGEALEYVDFGTTADATAAKPLNRLGDVNNDDKVTDQDMIKILELFLAKGYTAEADINQDGTIDIFDIQLLKQFILGTIDYEQFCAGKAA